MGYGFEVTSASGSVQIDQDFVNSRLSITGYCNTHTGNYGGPPYTGVYDLDLELPSAVNLDAEIPVILVRPSALGKYVGAVQFIRNYNVDGSGVPTTPTGTWNVQIVAECPFDYAIFSTLTTPVSDGSTHGLEVYRADGSVAYSSRHSHPRITDTFQIPSGGYVFPQSFGFPSKSATPWILANPLCTTFVGVGDGDENIGAVFMRVDTLASCTVQMLNVGIYLFDPMGTSVVAPASYNPYKNVPARFAICDFA